MITAARYSTQSSIPQRSMFWCDTRCSDKAVSFWQLASVVVEDGEECNTANLCQQCNNKKLVANGGAPSKKWQWYAVVEEKAHPGRLWSMLGERPVHTRNVGVFSCERLKAKKFREEAEKEKQEGIQGNGSANRGPRNTLNK